MDITTRNANLTDLVTMLRQQHDLKYDVVTSAQTLSYEGGLLVVRDGATRLDLDGVTLTDARLAPTAIFEDGVSSRLEIPRGYVRRMREQHIDLLDANVNGWLAMDPARKFLVRGFRTDDADDVGIARALLSDRFKVIDNLDIVFTVLDGIKAAGVPVDVTGADLTERRMTIRVQAPEVQALAPTLLKGYRSPFSGNEGAENPTVFAGFVVSNSETGGGAFTITPRLVVQVCSNGMTIRKDAMRSVHLGGRMDEGLIQWSDATQEKQLELIRARTVDAVRTFLDVDYMRRIIDEVEAKAATPLAAPVKAIANICKSVGLSDAEQDTLLDFFVRSGDTTAGGVMQAVTAMAQEVVDPDRANDLEDIALDVLDVAVREAATV